jgi:hypothetical protein
MTAAMYFSLTACVFIAPQLPPRFGRLMAIICIGLAAAVRLEWIE